MRSSRSLPPSVTGSTAPAAAPAEPAPLRPSQPPRPRAALPANGVVEGWVKAKATEVKGDDARPAALSFRVLARAAGGVKQRLVAVSYDFNTPAVMPQMQISSEQNTGFRVSAAGSPAPTRSP